MLAYDLSSNALIKSLEKEYGKQRSLQYLNKIVQIMNKAGEDWDNCKTIDDNMSKLIGDLTQMLATDVFITRMMKNQSLKAQFLATSFSDIIQEFLGYKDISLGNLTQNLYSLSWEAENYFKGLQDTEAQLRADWNTLPDDIKTENTKQGLAPGLPGWIAKVNEMNRKQRQDYENTVSNLFPYSQIPIERFRNFAHENGTNEIDLIEANNLLKTKDGGYILVPEDGKLTLPNGQSVELPFVCDIKNKIITMEISNPTCYENDGVIEFTISINRALNKDFYLELTTNDGTANGGSDFTKQENAEFFIPAGKTSQTFRIPVVRDGKFEDKENFQLKAVYKDGSYKGNDLKEVTNPTVFGVGTIIDIEQDKCPKPVTPNFSLNFPLPSSPSYYTPTYGGGGSGGGSSGGSSGGGGSSGSTYTPTPTPLPNVPYIECPNTPEQHSALVMKVNTSANLDNADNATYETREANNENSNLKNETNTSNLTNTNETSNSSNSENSNNETTQPNKIYFDYNNDGFKENMLTWFSKDEAVLVNDINNNGIVDNGSEILGSNYTDKFGNKVIDILSLLDEFDTNNDGIINNKDNTNLALWQDKNQNGKTDKDELIYLDDINSPIKSISLSKLDKLLSGYDRDNNLKINSNDGIYNYIFTQDNIDGSVNLYIYGDDSARVFLGDKRGDFIIQTNKFTNLNLLVA